jgi:hypothetical protein
MTKNTISTRNAYYIALSVILILAIAAVWTYRERMLFIDPAWVTFNIINTKTFSFSEHRYGAFITQLFPLAGTYLGLSIKTILILYALSFYLFYATVAFLTGTVFKQPWLTILLALYLTLFVSDSYYWPNNEVHQGIAWMCLFLGYYLFLSKESIKKKSFHYVLLFLLAFLAISCHLLVIVPLIFLWIFIHKEHSLPTWVRNRHVITVSLIITFWIVVRYLLSTSGWYDSVKLSGINEVSFYRLRTILQTGQAQSFIVLLLNNYWLAILVFAGSCWVLWRKRDFIGLAILLIFTGGYFCLICLTFPEAYNRDLRFYMESEWMAWTIIISYPLIIFLSKTTSNYFPILLLLLFSVRLLYIFNSYDFFHARYKRLEVTLAALQKAHIKKAIMIKEENAAKDWFIMDWGLPIETMLLSGIQGQQILTTLKMVHDNQTHNIPSTDSFHSCFRIQPIAQLNKQYFIIDTIQPYQKLYNTYYFQKQETHGEQP